LRLDRLRRRGAGRNGRKSNQNPADHPRQSTLLHNNRG
jgi:hypothetical protein